MHRSRLGGLIIDCRVDDLAESARFWRRALGRGERASDAPEDRGYVVLDTLPGEPHMELQRVDHDSRVHLDIETDDVDAEVARLEGLGARKVRPVHDWWVMEAPSGHRFCVVPAARDVSADRSRGWNEW